MLTRQQGSGIWGKWLARPAGYFLYLSLLLCLLVFVYGTLKLYVFAKMEIAVGAVPDDIGYFFKIARNVIAG